MKSQLLFCVFLTALLVSVCAEEYEDWGEVEEECVNELKLNKEEIQPIANEPIVPEDNEDFNKFLACYWTKKNVLDEEGVFDSDLLYQDFLEEFKKVFGKKPDIPSIIVGGLIKTAINSCAEKDIEASSHGQKAAKLQNCIVEKVFKDIEETMESKSTEEQQ